MQTSKASQSKDTGPKEGDRSIVATKYRHNDELERALRNYRLWERFEREGVKPLAYKRFQVDLPAEYVELLDEESDRRGFPRQALFKLIVHEWLETHLQRLRDEAFFEELVDSTVQHQGDQTFLLLSDSQHHRLNEWLHNTKKFKRSLEEEDFKKTSRKPREDFKKND